MRIRKGFRWSSILAFGIVLCVLLGGFGLLASSADAQTKKSRKTQHTTVRRSKSVHARTASLKKKKRYYRRSRRVRGQKAPTAERISEIQSALAKDGSFTGDPNGKWDSATTDAMKRFQAGHGLNPTGKLDALSLQRLGLGSATAGLAPPEPHARTTQTMSDNLPDQGNTRRQ